MWDVAHAFGSSIEGWTVLVPRHHVMSVADLTDTEVSELGPLVRDLSRTVQAVTGSPKTYVVQFAEHPQHPHVHLHVIPRDKDLEECYRGPRIFDLLGLPEDRCVPEYRMNQIADDLAVHMTSAGWRVR